ncbi:S8 family serine peptidase, partial [Candidatus Vampirococcus lugosii]
MGFVNRLFANFDKPYVEGEVIILYEDDRIGNIGPQNIESFVKGMKSKGYKTENIGHTSKNIVKLKSDTGNKFGTNSQKNKSKAKSTEELMKELSKEPGVKHVQPNFIYEIDDITKDIPDYDKLWGMDFIKWPKGIDIYNSEMQDPNKILVGVLDTGIDYNHPEFEGQMWNGDDCVDRNGEYMGDCIYGYDFASNQKDQNDVHGHGTHVSGTIAGSLNSFGSNGGIVGVNPYAQIMSLKVCNDNGTCPTSGIIRGINFAKENGAKVLNASLGYQSNCYFDELFYNTIKDFGDNGGVFIASAGNNSSDNDQTFFTPAGFGSDFQCGENSIEGLDNVISVASLKKDKGLSSFSNFGDKTVHIGAPGSSIYSSKPGNKYGNMSGTSMASPHIAGVVSLIWSFATEKTYSEIFDLIKNNGQELDSLDTKTIRGVVPDLEATLLSMTDKVEEKRYEVVFNLNPEDLKLEIEDNEGNEINGTGNIYKLVNGSYKYKASLTGYNSLTEEFEVKDEGKTINVDLEEKRYEVVFNVSPNVDYSLSINGDENFDLENVKAGEYNFEIKADGYQTYTGSFEVKDEGKTINVDLEEKRYEVVFNVSPNVDYSLSINGDENFDLENVKAGEYNFEIKADGYQTYTGSFEVKDEGKTINVDLEEKRYEVVFNLNPEDLKLEIEDNEGNEINGTGNIYKLVNGSYKYKASLTGYNSLTEEFEVKDEGKTINVDLEEERYEVVFNVSPNVDYSLSINGDENFDLENVKAGEYNFEIKA